MKFNILRLSQTQSEFCDFSVKMYAITIILFEYVTLCPTTVELLELSVVYAQSKYFHSRTVGRTIFRTAHKDFRLYFNTIMIFSR